MSKELTEEWRNGTLDRGFYYIVSRSNETYLCALIDYKTEKHWVKQVLAPVPTYDQFVELTEKVEGLEKQLNEANDVLKQIADTRYFQYGHKFAQSYIKKWGIK